MNGANPHPSSLEHTVMPRRQTDARADTRASYGLAHLIWRIGIRRGANTNGTVVAIVQQWMSDMQQPATVPPSAT